MRNLIILSHPQMASSQVHRTLIEAIDDLPDVKIHQLELLYPDGQIDVAAEQEACSNAQLLILQYPLQWFSTPPMLKHWLDEVFTHGWAYGAHGNALRGKHLQLVISSGSPAEAYRSNGYHHFSMSELLTPMIATAHLTGLRLLTPLILHGVPNVPGVPVNPQQEALVSAFATRYRQTLLHYADQYHATASAN